jgi:predicted RNA-binding protein with PUA-like domain
MRAMKVGDLVFFYHSNADPPAIVGTAEVVREAYPDPTAFEKRHQHYDPKSKPEKPLWDMVDIRLANTWSKPLSLERLRAEPALKGMELLRKGSRLSVQPVGKAEWALIMKLAEASGLAPA